MKKLKLSELNLSNAEVLTREQLKNVKGGRLPNPPNGTCRYHYVDGGISYVSDCYSESYVQSSANSAVADGYQDAGWCCDSCESAGWGGCPNV